MKIRKVLYANVSAAAFLAAWLAAGPSHALTLKEAVNTALHSNPEIGQAIENREAIEFELRQAKGLYLPSVDLEASAGVEVAGQYVQARRSILTTMQLEPRRGRRRRHAETARFRLRGAPRWTARRRGSTAPPSGFSSARRLSRSRWCRTIWNTCCRPRSSPIPRRTCSFTRACWARSARASRAAH